MKSEKADGAEGGSGGWIIVTRQPQFKNVNREDDHDGQWSPCVGVPALLVHDDIYIMMKCVSVTKNHHFLL